MIVRIKEVVIQSQSNNEKEVRLLDFEKKANK